MKDSKPQTSRIAASGKTGGLNAEIQSRIGHQLRAMYDDVVRQGVPDRFADLVRRLDGPEAAQAQLANSHSDNDLADSEPGQSGELTAKKSGRD